MATVHARHRRVPRHCARPHRWRGRWNYGRRHYCVVRRPGRPSFHVKSILAPLRHCARWKRLSACRLTAGQHTPGCPHSPGYRQHSLG